MTKATLYIIRGLPGSGKTTKAMQLQATFNSLGVPSYRCEADYWHHWSRLSVEAGFMDEKYQFMPELVPIAHALCLNETKLYLLRGVNVIVSNTFTTKKEMNPYLEFCEDHDIDYEIIECDGNYGSIHNVPEHVINNMRNRWEKI